MIISPSSTPKFLQIPRCRKTTLSCPRDSVCGNQNKQNIPRRLKLQFSSAQEQEHTRINSSHVNLLWFALISCCFTSFSKLQLPKMEGTRITPRGTTSGLPFNHSPNLYLSPSSILLNFLQPRQHRGFFKPLLLHPSLLNLTQQLR